jgi:hypothetical protein
MVGRPMGTQNPTAKDDKCNGDMAPTEKAVIRSLTKTMPQQ